jgi:hypothetical protein
MTTTVRSWPTTRANGGGPAAFGAEGSENTRAEGDASLLRAPAGPKPHELYGKFTWKIENFSEISKRELRSNVFDVGSYKW